MSEIRRQGASDPPVEFLDDHGNELIPAQDVALILELPELLEPELREAASDEKPAAEEDFKEGVELIGGSLGGTFAIADDNMARGKLWTRLFKENRITVTEHLAGADGYFWRPFKDIWQAVHKLAPAELDYFLDLTTANRAIDEGNLVTAGHIEKPSMVDRLRGRAPRLYDNTPENLVTFQRVVTAYNGLSFLEGYSRSAKTLEMAITLGDKKHAQAATGLLRRLRNIACSDMGMDDKVIAQFEVGSDIAKLIDSLPFDHMGPELHDQVRNRASHLMEILWQGRVRERALVMMSYGREFRMNGNQHPRDPEPATAGALPAETEGPISPETPEPTAAPESLTPESELEPQEDILALYKSALKNLLSGAEHENFTLLTTKEAKKRDLGDAREVLVKGETDLDGNVVVAGRSKIDAHRYVSGVEFLRSFIDGAGGDVATAKELLEQASSASSEYGENLQMLLDEAAGLLPAKQMEGLRNQAPASEDIAGIVSYIREDWEAISFVIKKYWPSDGKKTAEQLRQLLFLDRDDIVEIIKQQVELAEPEPEEPLELQPDEEIIIRNLEEQEELEAIAKQLDEIILPSQATQEDVKRGIESSGIPEEQAVQIDWARLYNLVKLREVTNGTMYKSKQGDLGNAPPYFVVAIDFKGTTYAVAESPVEGNATYVISEKEVPGTWLEVLQLDKATARELGARRVIHRSGKTTRDHLIKIQDVLIELATVDPQAVGAAS